MTGQIEFGSGGERAQLRLELLGYEHPDVAEPEGLDLLHVRAHAHAPPADVAFDVEIAVYELRELGEYLAEINSGNGPSRTFELAGGLLALAFAPSRRGPVLCAVRHKNIDLAHLRVEYLITLEPSDITRCLAQLRDVR
jgi:hypothetical protein